MRLIGPGKMKIRHRGEEYEGIPASNAIGMALFEASGMRSLIDQRCKYDSERRILSPGMVVKALIGPTFNITKKFPLYQVHSAYTAAPTERLFGPGVTKDDLYDTALGRGLDTLFDTDLNALFTECASMAVKKFGFESNVLHMDSTDVSVWGMEHPPDKEGAAIPLHNGHPKDKRYDLLQYEMQAVTDSNDIIRYMKPYSGNVSDSVMDSETIEDLGRIFSDEERMNLTIVGDCKLPTAKNIGRIIDLKMRFVSKCAENFKDDAKNKVVEWASGAEMKEASKGGLWIADTDLDIELKKGRTERLRFVAFRWEGKVKRAADRISEKAMKEARAFALSFRGKRYNSEDLAMKDLAEHLEGIPDTYFFHVSTRLYPSMTPESVGWWELDLEPLISDENIRSAAEKEVTIVLVTNLDRPVEDGEAVPDNYRPASNEDVLDLYNQEYHVERSFRFMKSGVGMNSVFLQTPSRVNAMMFVISIAVLVSNIADAMFKRADTRSNGRRLTMYNLAFELQTTLVTYSRSENSLILRGPDEVTEAFFDYTDTLLINPQYLLGYAED